MEQLSQRDVELNAVLNKISESSQTSTFQTNNPSKHKPKTVSFDISSKYIDKNGHLCALLVDGENIGFSSQSDENEDDKEEILKQEKAILEEHRRLIQEEIVDKSLKKIMNMFSNILANPNSNDEMKKFYVNQEYLKFIKQSNNLDSTYRFKNQIANDELAAASFGGFIAYRTKEGQTKVLSFGSGDTLNAIRRKDGKTETVKPAQNFLKTNSHYDPISFPINKVDFTAKQIEYAFVTRIDEISSGDQYFMFTDGAYAELSHEVNIAADTETTILKENALSSDLTADQIRQNIIDSANANYSRKLENNKGTNRQDDTKYGDDVTIFKANLSDSNTWKEIDDIDKIYSRLENVLKRCDDYQAKLIEDADKISTSDGISYIYHYSHETPRIANLRSQATKLSFYPGAEEENLKLSKLSLKEKVDVIQKIREIVKGNALSGENKLKEIQSFLEKNENSDILKQHRSSSFKRFIGEIYKIITLNFKNLGKTKGTILQENISNLVRSRL